MRKAAFVLLMATMASAAWGADKLKAEEVVAKHLAALGTAEARAAAKTRVGEGKAQMQEVVRGSAELNGSASLACDNRRLKIAMRFPGASQYPGEQWLFNGEKVLVAMTVPGARSAIGNFLYSNPEILREGLLGGALTTTWSLLDVGGRQPRLKYDGLKRIDGRELHQVTYIPRKGGSNMEIRLFFEPETFRHVRTTYLLTVTAGIGSDVGQHEAETRHLLQEDFGDFQAVEGLMLPMSWKIRFGVENVGIEPTERPSANASAAPGASKTSSLQWNIKVEKVLHNVEM